MWLYLYLSVVLFQEALAQWNNTIYVSNTGSDSQSCLSDGSTDNACQTLEYATSGMANLTRIVLLEGNHKLNTTIRLSGYRSIAITGMGSAENHQIECSSFNSSGGLHFARIDNLYISNITFVQCGSLVNGTNWDSSAVPVKNNMFRSAMYVINCTDITVESTQFTNGTGKGLVLFNANGLVSIVDSNFTCNMVPYEERLLYPGGGGLYIEHTYCTDDCTNEGDLNGNPHRNNSVYTIRNCKFLNNEATDLLEKWSLGNRPDANHFGWGGGVYIVLKRNSSNNVFWISDCDFISNVAPLGGGLAISMQDFTSNNSIQISDCLLQGNTAHQGGGGSAIGYAFAGCDHLPNNKMLFKRSNFTLNAAAWGGGMYFYARHFSSPVANRSILHFVESIWVNNSAVIGAAAHFAPEAWSTPAKGYLNLPVPAFVNCTFEENRIIGHGFGNRQLSTSGVLFVDSISVDFIADNAFKNNVGTALYANSGSINVLNNAFLLFDGNKGIQGGALALADFSSLCAFPGSNVFFMNNYAVNTGGAIYSSSTDITEYMYTCSCFIRYSNVTEHPDSWKVGFYFVNNTAGQNGHSIYADTILPCARVTLTTDYNRVFNWTPFHYSDPDQPNNIATAPINVTLQHNNSTASKLSVSPGEVFSVHPQAKDILNNSVTSVYKAYIPLYGANSTIKLDHSYSYVSDGYARVTGDVGSTFNLTLQTLGNYPVASSVSVSLIYCPPGFVLHQNKSGTSCICSASTTNQKYAGVIGCNDEHFHGLLSKGYWAGCARDGSLLTASCPDGFCRDITGREQFVAMNKTCDDLDTFLCGDKGRTGLLCGKCRDGFSVVYHSHQYSCSSEDCKLGWLFYVLVELVPVTILFVIIMLLNINLTSGHTYSFIFFAQTVDFLQGNAMDKSSLPPGIHVMTQIYHFIFGFLNLNFFEADALSFCLWKGATVLDVLTFSYVTTAFGLLLLLVLVLVFRFFPCYRCCKLIQTDSSVIHGMSAFLILSYAQCAKVSFQILTVMPLFGENFERKKSVVYLSGTTEFFSDEHLPYAIPAILILLFFCTLPPLVLIIYPTCSRIPWSEKWPRLRFSWFRRHVFDLNNLKPLLDSFQGCFKDNYRFFAGLYLLYRLAIAAEYAFSTTATGEFVCLEIIFVLMLTFHAIAQPYQKRIHNTVDALIFADLAIINGINFYAYFWSGNQMSHTSDLRTALWIQLILIYLPILYVTVLIMAKLTKLLCRRRKGNQEQYSEELNDEDLPDRLLHEDEYLTQQQMQPKYGALAARTT